MAAVQETVDRVRSIDVDAYKYGFVTDIESDKAPKGLNEDTVRFISAKKGEPQWLLDWRLEAYRRWLTMETPRWARVEYPEIDFQAIYYFSAPKSAAGSSNSAAVESCVSGMNDISAVGRDRVSVPAHACLLFARSPYFSANEVQSQPYSGWKTRPA